MDGRSIQVTLHVRDTVTALKQRLSDALGGMPVNKQQLTGAGLPVFKDKDALAVYNLRDGDALHLKVKVRGGR